MCPFRTPGTCGWTERTSFPYSLYSDKKFDEPCTSDIDTIEQIVPDQKRRVSIKISIANNFSTKNFVCDLVEKTCRRYDKFRRYL